MVYFLNVEVTTLLHIGPHALRHFIHQAAQRFRRDAAPGRADVFDEGGSDAAGSILSTLSWTISQRFWMSDRPGLLPGHIPFVGEAEKLAGTPLGLGDGANWRSVLLKNGPRHVWQKLALYWRSILRPLPHR